MRLTPTRIADPRLFASAAGLMLTAQWTHAATEFGGQSASNLFSRWVYVAIVVASGLAVISSCLRRKPVRKAWCAFGAGLLSVAVGDVIYNLAPNLNSVPVPSVSDPFWLLFYPCAYVGLLLLVRDRVRISLVATRLDGIICGVSVASILACVSLPLAAASSAHSPFWETATNMAYPVCDLVLLGAVPDSILQKPGPLSPSEWELIRQHTIIGQRILFGAPALQHVGELIRASHERYDGTGYPDGLCDEEIPLASRIIAVADAFDAMTTAGSYNATRSGDAALAELRRCAGTQSTPRSRRRSSRPSATASGSAKPPEQGPRRRPDARASELDRAHAVVARVVLDLGQPEPLEHGRHVVAESPPQSFLESVPPTDRVLW